jgi:hypothetical protein
MVKNANGDSRTALMQAADIQSAHPRFWVRLLDVVMRFITNRRPIPAAKPASVQAALMPIDPRVFEDTSEGSGAFGRWMLDEENLPCYSYEMDQHRDVRAYYVNTEGQDRREHWHQIGNNCVTALASNEGTVQVYLANRGGIFLNRANTTASDKPTTWTGYVNAVFRLLLRWYGQLRAQWIRLRTRKAIVPRVAATLDTTTAATVMALPKQTRTSAYQDDFAFAGGYGYLSDGEDSWASAYRYAPAGAKTQRIFGVGYFKTAMTYKDIHQTRRVYAPLQDVPGVPKDDGILLAEVEVENLRQIPVDLQYYEYWDVNIQQMQIEWIRTGLAAPFSDNKRFEINLQFDPSMISESDPQALRFHQEFRSGGVLDGVDRREIDITPFDVFLANLNPTAAGCYVNKVEFFGKGRGLNPDAIRSNLPPTAELPVLPGPMPYCLIMRHSLHLEPGEKTTLRYAFGAVEPQQPLGFLQKYINDEGWFQKSQQVWKKRLAYFSTGSDPVLQRETTWHAYNLLSATLFSEYFNCHYTPQGSAYLYLHGAEGVPRDQSLFTLAMVYINPALAREMLTLLLSLRDASPDGLALPYGYVGNGAVVRDALKCHAYPSDLDIYILLALSEYLAATGDTGFLDVKIPLYRFDGKTNMVAPITVLDHIRTAFNHLDKLGLGDNNLLKIGDGDWDDGIVIINVLNPLKNGDIIDLNKTIAKGESVPNTQMAVYTLPLIASIMEKCDPELAAKMRDKAQMLTAALKVKQWDPDRHWFYRAYLRDYANNPVLIGDHHLSLQSQVWPLISGLAEEMNIEPDLVKTLRSLDDPSPTGTMIEEKGQVWPAISQLVTWGYRRNHPELAWRSLNRHTFAAHATAFPNIWHNIWSGPDGTNSKGSPNEGGSWSSVVTPMTDFPVMNSNQDAMAFIGLLRVCGIEPSMQGDGLDITLKAPPERYILDTQLLRLEVDTGRIRGEYRACAAGQCTLHVHLPRTATSITGTIDGTAIVDLSENADHIDIPLTFQVDQKIRFEARWN